MDKLLNVLKDRKEELYDMLSNLIKIDSQNFGCKGNEKEIAVFICDEIRKLGYQPDMYSPKSVEGILDHPDYWHEHDMEERYNVSAVIKGKDSSKRVMIAAHLDTVPIGDENNWTVPPFGGIIKDGKIWGRGACDDKYGIATMLYILKVFKDEDIVPEFDIVFTAYCNEEFGGGNGALAACLKYPCDDIINLDCKNFEIWNCAVGGGEMKVYIRSKSPVDNCGVMLEGLNILKEEFEQFRNRRIAELNEHEEYRGTIIPDTSVRFIEIKAGNEGNDLDKAYGEICYYATLSKEKMDEELNQIGESLNEKLNPINLEFDKIEVLTRYFHFAKTEKDNPLMDKLISSAKEVSGRTLKPCGSCQSDLSLFIKNGSKRAFSFGIGRDFGTYGGAHQADEYIECEKLLEFAEIVASTIM